MREKRLLATLVLGLVVVVAAEVGLRLIAPQWMFCFRTRACPQPYTSWFLTQRGPNFSPETGEPLLVFDPELLWRPRPNVTGTFWGTAGVQTNSLGLRDRPADLAKGRSVLVVGNSVVWGGRVAREERFTDRASSLLAREVGHEDVQIINAGVPGYSSFQVLQFLKHVALPRFKPEVVMICVGVDDNWLADHSDREKVEANTGTGPAVRRLVAKSDLLLFLNRYVVELVVWAGTGQNLKGFSLFYGDPPGPPRVTRVSPAEAVANLREAGELAAAHGGRVAIMLQATSDEQPDSWLRDSFLEARSRFAGLARQKGWTVVDMADLGRPPLQLPPDSCFADFCNPTPRAHAVLGYLTAEAVTDLLRP
jgi:hypothetical protein